MNASWEFICNINANPKTEMTVVLSDLRRAGKIGSFMYAENLTLGPLCQLMIE